ncbi:MAG: DUF4142 domain-containing protein [Bryobacteraceae bacterium]|nr:DUF4142 domain-containing protein [Bryobacteraceae bacterium]
MSTDKKTTDSKMSGMSGGAMVGKADSDFMMKAAMGGMMEMQLAQAAQQKASSQEVKDLARKIEQDHKQASDKLKAIAAERHVDLPATMGPEHEKMMAKVTGLTGEEFDRAYTKLMVADHKKDIREFEKAVNRSMDSDLKNFASATLPSLKEHLTSAQQLSTSTRSRAADKK